MIKGILGTHSKEQQNFHKHYKVTDNWCICVGGFQVSAPSLCWEMITRHSEKDSTPEPLDQWKNSPFIGQQVGNLPDFHIDPLLGRSIYLPCTMAQSQSHCASNIMSNYPFHSKWVNPPIPELQQFQYFTLKIQGQGHDWGQVWSHNVNLTFYRLTSLLFHVNPPSHSWDTTFSKSDLENQRSRSWKRWTLKVTRWVQHSIDSHSFRSMTINHPMLKIWLFQILTLKIHGQGYGWGECWKSQHGSNILSTHIPFIPCQSAIPFLRYKFFQIWPWKSKVKVMTEVKVESHKVGVTSYLLTSLSFYFNQPSHSWDTAFLKFDLENTRSRLWVRWTLKVTTWAQHSIHPHPFNSMSIGHPIPEIRLFQYLTLKIQGQDHGWGERWKSQSGCNILSTHIPFVPCQSAHPFLRYRIFKIWPWKSTVKVKWPWCCTTTGLDNFIELEMV